MLEESVTLTLCELPRYFYKMRSAPAPKQTNQLYQDT